MSARDSQYSYVETDVNGNVTDLGIGGYLILPTVIVHRVTQQTYGNFLKHNSFIRFAANLVDVGIQRTDFCDT